MCPALSGWLRPCPEMQDTRSGCLGRRCAPLCTACIRLHPETPRVLGHGGHHKTGGSSGAGTTQPQGLEGVWGEAEGSGFVQPESSGELRDRLSGGHWEGGRMKGNRHKLIWDQFGLDMGKHVFITGTSNVGAGCVGRLCSLCPWRHSRPNRS